MKEARHRIFLVFLISFLFTCSSYAQQQQAEPVRLEKVAEGVYEILGGHGANGGLIIGDNGVLVIDAKMTQDSVEQTLNEIKKLTNLPVKYLINSHSDGDHVYGNRFFPETVTIIAHENCRREFFHPRRDGEPSEWNNPQLASYIPSLTFSRKMDVYLGEKKVELWYFGVGHTTGDTVVYIPEEKTAFIGDQFFSGRPQLIHAYKGGNSFEHVKTLEKMLEALEAEIFCSGHSRPVDRETIKNHIDNMKKLRQKIKTMVENKMTLEEIKQQFEENKARLVEVVYNEIKGDVTQRDTLSPGENIF